MKVNEKPVCAFYLGQLQTLKEMVDLPPTIRRIEASRLLVPIGVLSRPIGRSLPTRHDDPNLWEKLAVWSGDLMGELSAPGGAAYLI